MARPRDAERSRLLLIGLDGVPPELLFDRLLPQLPNLGALIRRGTRAPLRTTDPPISVPAWPVMFSGVDPGTLGLYGFRHRRPGNYTEMHIPTADEVPVPMLWHLLSEQGRRVAVIGMPPGFPPPSVNGAFISDFLTPPESPVTTHPPALRAEIDRRFGRYMFDVTFRSGERDVLAAELFEMTRRRFEVAEWLYDQEEWDLFAVHEIGTDRLHHGFWKYFDPSHPAYEPNGPFAAIAEKYYRLVDERIGRLLARVDDRTHVFVVSDHGSMAMRGCVCINQWLASKGYLVLKNPSPAPGTPLEQKNVDWHRTTVWAAGGYYARIFFNLRGREAEGCVPLADLPGLRADLINALHGLVGPDGRKLPVTVLDPREIYASVTG
ncbi:MAG: alkaline phosphatase family protein, partial [Thermoplasmata archaeon]|nr:alkaline phosphatase family protein [Thermoplasmata archaeon]